MLISQLKINDLVAILFPETGLNSSYKEYAIVTNVDESTRETQIRPFSQSDIISIPWDKADIANQIADIPLSKIWFEKLGFEPKEGNLFALPSYEYWYERTVIVNEFVFIIQAKLENGIWVLVFPKPTAKFMCRFENLSSVRSLQNMIRSKYHIELPLDYKKSYDPL